MEKDYSKIYDVHKYWSRKPWHPISNCIMKYSNEGDTVVDLFLGSGVTALESILLNRDFNGYDLNPISIFISKNTLTYNLKKDEYLNELKILENNLSDITKELYISNELCDICGNNLILNHAIIGPKYMNKELGVFFCEKCGKRKSKKVRLLKNNEKSKNYYPISKWTPDVQFPKKFYKDRFSYKGIKKVNDMFTSRNLYFMSELYYIINNSDFKYKDLFLLAFSNTLLHVSKLKSENVRPLSVNNYWVPDDYIEENPLLRFKERANRILKAKETLKKRIIYEKNIGRAILKKQSSLKTGLQDESIDYIITDPPYGDAIQYSELSYIWNAWMKDKYDIEEELIINPVQNKNINDFLYFFDKSVNEANRILKHDKYYTLCFHNKDFIIWEGVLNIFKKYNFTLENIDIVNLKGNSYNTNWSKFNPKTDLYLTFRKSVYKPTHKKKYSIRDILFDINKENKVEPISKLYDLLCIKLIYELYYNEYKISINDLSIKKLAKLLGEINNAN